MNSQQYKQFRKMIEARVNAGENVERIMNEPESKVEKKLRAIIIAEIAPEKLIGEIWNERFQNLFRLLTDIVGMDRRTAETVTSIMFYVLDSGSLAKLLNFASVELRER